MFSVSEPNSASHFGDDVQSSLVYLDLTFDLTATQVALENPLGFASLNRFTEHEAAGHMGQCPDFPRTARQTSCL